jgi:hypothetical protein
MVPQWSFLDDLIAGVVTSINSTWKDRCPCGTPDADQVIQYPVKQVSESSIALSTLGFE